MWVHESLGLRRLGGFLSQAPHTIHEPSQISVPRNLLGLIREGRMSEEREQLNKAFVRSRSRFAYINVGLALLLLIAAVVTIWLIVLDYY